ncbi:MAG: DUF3892 domain-containing protein [Deltaproteobacteria bacterium]|nr:DUF3892 domain-containing protein [Nannocystaceae bacterium]
MSVAARDAEGPHHDAFDPSVQGGAITGVILSQDGKPAKDIQKSAVIALMRDGEAVSTAPPTGTGARVSVVEAMKPYLKTDKNGTEADNLGGLPTY